MKPSSSLRSNVLAIVLLVFIAGCTPAKKLSPVANAQPLTNTQPEFLYLADQFGAQIVGLRIDDAGRLSSVPGSPFRTDDPVHLMAGPGERFIYREDMPEDFREFTAQATIAWFEINPQDGSVRRGGSFEHSPGRCLGSCAAMGPEGQQLYVLESSTNFENPTINVYGISPDDGSLVKTASIPARSDSSRLALHASGKFLFEIEWDSTALHVTSYRRSDSGTLEFASTLTFAPVGHFTVPETSPFLYLATQNGLEALSIDMSSGALQRVPDAVTPDLTGGLVFDQTGQFVLAQKTGGLFALHRVQSDGKLQPVQVYDFGRTLGGADSVYGMVFDKTNRFLVVYSDTQAASFRFDLSGGISEQPVSVFATNAGTPSQAITVIPE